jgi:uncharacterized membrane protein YfcA
VAVVAAASPACLYAAYTLPRGIIDGYFLLLMLVTAVIGSRIAIRIPQINVNITVDDTFVFIALLHYGGEAAVMIGALAGVCSALRISRKVEQSRLAAPRWRVQCSHGNASEVCLRSYHEALQGGASLAIIALCLMGWSSTWSTPVSARCQRVQANESIWRMWSRNFLWISISYFAGAAGAGFIVSSLGTARFWAFLICIPIIIIVYFSYDRYMREVKASARHAEEAERARAESEHRARRTGRATRSGAQQLHRRTGTNQPRA